mmetsp:Transcript_21962/g.70741  ORF Transcript_21962/g.70741 Transcript_21962/m.70741 type:complete len:212 (-) Transcript_21962:1325-1960(-)
MLLFCSCRSRCRLSASLFRRWWVTGWRRAGLAHRKEGCGRSFVASGTARLSFAVVSSLLLCCCAVVGGRLASGMSRFNFFVGREGGCWEGGVLGAFVVGSSTKGALFVFVLRREELSFSPFARSFAFEVLSGKSQQSQGKKDPWMDGSIDRRRPYLEFVGSPGGYFVVFAADVALASAFSAAVALGGGELFGEGGEVPEAFAALAPLEVRV